MNSEGCCNECYAIKLCTQTYKTSQKWHPYKVNIEHELHEDDFDRRIHFCVEMNALCEENDSQLSSFSFFWRVFIFVNGWVNTHNCWYWALEDPHVFVESNLQWPQKHNVRAGILETQLLACYSLIDGPVYHNSLQEYTHPFIIHIIENSVNDDGESQYDDLNVYFQQDGAPPPHFSRLTREWLNDYLELTLTVPSQMDKKQEEQLVKWPARSQDLTPVACFLWNFKLFWTKDPSSRSTRLQKQHCAGVQSDISQNINKNRLEFQNRLFYCFERNREHIEYLVWFHTGKILKTNYVNIRFVSSLQTLRFCEKLKPYNKVCLYLEGNPTDKGKNSIL